MNRRLPGSSSGAEQAKAHDVVPRISIPGGQDGDNEDFPSLANGHSSPDKKQVVDAGLKSLDHCTFLLPICNARIGRPGHL